MAFGYHQVCCKIVAGSSQGYEGLGPECLCPRQLSWSGKCSSFCSWAIAVCLSCFLTSHFPARALRCHSSSQVTKGFPSSTDFMSDPVVGFALYLCIVVFLCLCMCVRLCICAHACRPTSYMCWCVNLNAHLTFFLKHICWEGGARVMMHKEKSEGTL